MCSRFRPVPADGGRDRTSCAPVGLDLGDQIFLVQASDAFSLIHADGQPLDRSVAADVVAADRQAGGDLYDLDYLPSNILERSK